MASSARFGGVAQASKTSAVNAASSPVTDRINGERLVVLGWPRAILMQLAHPLIAAGVCHHSSVRDNAAAPIYRLHATVTAMLGIAFGTEAERNAVIAHIKQIHTRVNGQLAESVGPFPRGTPYSAEDPALVLWVHATLVDTSLLFYDRLVGPLDDTERDEYCRVSASVAIELGARDVEVPTDWRRMNEYLERMLGSRTLTVGPDARLVADALMHAKALRVAWPLSSLVKRLTIGSLSSGLREQYGFPWTEREEAALPSKMRRIRHLRRLVPDVLGRWSTATHARLL